MSFVQVGLELVVCPYLGFFICCFILVFSSVHVHLCQRKEVQAHKLLKKLTGSLLYQTNVLNKIIIQVWVASFHCKLLFSIFRKPRAFFSGPNNDGYLWIGWIQNIFGLSALHTHSLVGVYGYIIVYFIKIFYVNVFNRDAPKWKFLAETEYTETVGRIPNLAFTVFHLRTIYLLNKLVKHIFFFFIKKKNVRCIIFGLFTP